MNPDRHLNDMVDCIGGKSPAKGLDLALIYAGNFVSKKENHMVTDLAERLRMRGMSEVADAVAKLLTPELANR